MRVSPLTHNDVLYVTKNMREWDRREIEAVRFDASPLSITETVMACGDFGWVCGLERPIAVIGAIPLYPGVWSCWLFATEEVRRIRISLTRFAKRDIMGAMLKSGAHRAECRSMEGHTDAHAWLESLGATREAVHPMAGKDGETFYTFAWTGPKCA